MSQFEEPKDCFTFLTHFSEKRRFNKVGLCLCLGRSHFFRKLPFDHAGRGRCKGKAVNSRLARIENWIERAQHAGFHISALAADCRVSERQLRRFVESEFGIPPHVWMMGLRLRGAPLLLRQRLLIKEVAYQLGFKSADHFSRVFKRQYGVGPRQFRHSERPG